MHTLSVERQKPTLDAQHLQQLSEEASPVIAESFAKDYAALLPRRVGRVVHAVNLRDRDMAVDASLSLKTTSWLAGALRLNQLCRELELALALDDWAAAISVARNIELHLPRLQDALACRPRPALAGP
ncbi:hypothetical protein [Arthrobacter sp. ISL-65]|uniref:hypothetical protein n=1 Tax=Arthrobacter sp. ISL-65 TaxID=2819112 RepID=UPI001BECA5C4|nr:hypothetical protein [Arthrobacter sp. ISL-65]MBT2548951.1 hypothetical protein [Arthrobacter sp. ISL-65]